MKRASYNYSYKELARLTYYLTYGAVKHKWSFAYMCKWLHLTTYSEVSQAMCLWNACELCLQGRVFKRGGFIYQGNPDSPRSEWRKILEVSEDEVLEVV